MNTRLFTVIGIVLAVHLLVVGAFWLGVRRGRSQTPPAHQADFAVLPDRALPAPIVDASAERETRLPTPTPVTQQRQTGPVPIGPGTGSSSTSTGSTRTSPPTAITPRSEQTVASAAGAARYHVVQPGESYWKISQKYNVSVDKLKAANNATTDTLRVDQKLVIP